VQWEADSRTWAFTYIGPQAGRLLGYPLERWYEPDFWKDQVHPDDAERVTRFREQAAREQEACEYEYRLVGASGQSVWVHDVFAVERAQDAPPVIRGFLIDISERKRAEATAAASEARVRQLIEQAPNAIIAVRADGQIAFVNHQAERLFGYQRGELVGSPFESLVPGRLVVERLARDHADGMPQGSRAGTSEDTNTGVCRDGRTFPAEINLSPLETDEGVVVVVTIRDLSEQLAAETALRDGEERFRIAANLAVDIILETNLETGQIVWYGQVDQALGYADGEFPRTLDAWMDHLHPDDRDRVRAVGQEQYLRPEGTRLDCRVRAKDGSYRHWSVRAAPRLTGRGRPTTFVAVCSDVTDQVVARAEALQHREALAHVARVNSLGELTATLAHELNQPLTAILSNAQAAVRLLARDQPDVTQVREVLRDIVADDRRASAIIQRLRAMMRRDTGPMERIDLCQVVREVLEIMRGELSTRHLTVIPAFADALPPVLADRIQIQQVVVNLVTNAMQAMEGLSDPRLTMRVRARGDGWQIVSVADSGAGIAAAVTETMFEPFTSSRKGGLGMGLSISRSIIEAHGGHLSAENHPTGGAIVSFGLPPEAAAGA